MSCASKKFKTNSAEWLLPSQNCHAHTSANAPDFSCLLCLVGLLALLVLLTYLMSKLSPSSASLFYSVAKEQRTLTSSSHAPSHSSHHQTSWSSPTSTRLSLQASLSSTRSLCTHHSVTAYEKDRETSLKNLPVHCHPIIPTASPTSDHNSIKAHSKPLCVGFIQKQQSRVLICSVGYVCQYMLFRLDRA